MGTSWLMTSGFMNGPRQILGTPAWFPSKSLFSPIRNKYAPCSSTLTKQLVSHRSTSVEIIVEQAMIFVKEGILESLAEEMNDLDIDFAGKERPLRCRLKSESLKEQWVWKFDENTPSFVPLNKRTERGAYVDTRFILGSWGEAHEGLKCTRIIKQSIENNITRRTNRQQIARKNIRIEDHETVVEIMRLISDRPD